MKKSYLQPMNNQKSFYGKAIIIERDDGSTDLQSYNTIVCSIDGDGQFIRRWGGWSATTQKHVNAFIERYGIAGGGKAWWQSLPVA